MTRLQVRALRQIAEANQHGRLAPSHTLRDVHSRTLRSLEQRGSIRLTLPEVGIDGWEITERGQQALARVTLPESVRAVTRRHIQPPERSSHATHR